MLKSHDVCILVHKAFMFISIAIYLHPHENSWGKNGGLDTPCFFRGSVDLGNHRQSSHSLRLVSSLVTGGTAWGVVPVDLVSRGRTTAVEFTDCLPRLLLEQEEGALLLPHHLSCWRNSQMAPSQAAW